MAASSDAGAGSEPALLDRLADQEEAAKRERDAAGPDHPLRAEALFEADLGFGRRRQGARAGSGSGGDGPGRRFTGSGAAAGKISGSRRATGSGAVACASASHCSSRASRNSSGLRRSRF